MGVELDRLVIVGVIALLVDISKAKEIPAFFIFGDSLVDVGNNYYINTAAIPKFPNGIDFGYPFGIPSGRFTNGRTVIDILGQEVGLKNFTPPYLAPTTTGDMVLKGVNYASSASGILNHTEWFFGDQINLDTQISNYAKTRKDIISRIGKSAAKKLFGQALYVVSVGSNDVMFGNLLNSSSWNTFLDSLVSRLGSQLKRLYLLDARKILVTNCAVVGCIPFEKDLHSSINGCEAHLNQKAQLYNRRLNRLLAELTTHLQASNFVSANVYAMLEDILQNYKSYGFENADSACCRSGGRHGGVIPCGKLSQICPERSKYVFWDPFHLTETSYMIIAKHIMDGGLNYISPINVRQLLKRSATHENTQI